MHFEAIQAYEYLYASVQPRSRFVQKQAGGDANLSEVQNLLFSNIWRKCVKLPSPVIIPRL